MGGIAQRLGVTPAQVLIRCACLPASHPAALCLAVLLRVAAAMAASAVTGPAVAAATAKACAWVPTVHAAALPRTACLPAHPPTHPPAHPPTHPPTQPRQVEPAEGVCAAAQIQPPRAAESQPGCVQVGACRSLPACWQAPAGSQRAAPLPQLGRVLCMARASSLPCPVPPATAT